MAISDLISSLLFQSIHFPFLLHSLSLHNAFRFSLNPPTALLRFLLLLFPILHRFFCFLSSVLLCIFTLAGDSLHVELASWFFDSCCAVVAVLVFWLLHNVLIYYKCSWKESAWEQPPPGSLQETFAPLFFCFSLSVWLVQKWIDVFASAVIHYSLILLLF